MSRSRPLRRPLSADLDRTCPINWDHPLNRGLVAEWAVVSLSGWSGTPKLYDLVRGGKNPHDGTLTSMFWSSRFGLRSLQPITGIGNGVTVNRDPILDTFAANQMTLAVFFAVSSLPPTNTENYNEIVRKEGSYNITLSHLAGDTGAMDTLDMTVKDSGGTAHAVGVPFTSINKSVPAMALVSYDGATVRGYYFDSKGGLVTGTNVGTFTIGQVTTNNLYFGNYAQSGTPGSGAGGDRWFDGNIAAVLLWNRAVNTSEPVVLWDQLRRGNPDSWRWLSRTAFFTKAAASGVQVRQVLSVGGQVLSVGSQIIMD